MAARDGYGSVRPLGNAIIGMLGIDIAARLAYMAATMSYLSHLRGLIQREGPNPYLDPTEGLLTSEILQLLLSLVSSLLSIFLTLAIGVWIYRAAWNVRHLGAVNLRYSPGWCVGWHFVPFANLVMPFRAMKEIWLASHDPSRALAGRVPLLSWWWALWLTLNISALIYLRFALMTTTVPELATIEFLGLFLDALAIGLAIVFIGVVKRVVAAQQRLAGKAPVGGVQFV